MRLKYPMEYLLAESYEDAVDWLESGNKLWFIFKNDMPNGQYINIDELNALKDDLPISEFSGIHKYPKIEETVELPKARDVLMSVKPFRVRNGEAILKEVDQGEMFYAHSSIIDEDRILVRVKNVPFQLDMDAFANINHLIIDNILNKK